MAETVLFHTDYNPIPEGAASGFVTTPDGLKIRYGQWKSLTYPVKGSVLLLHGRAEFIEKLFETVTDLRKSGFDVVTFDWRGQGGSERLLSNPRKGYVDSFDQYTLDLETIMQDVALPDCKAPYYIVAHSTGALAALYSAPRFTNRIRRMVLSSPLLGFGKIPLPHPVMKFVTGTFSAIGLGELYLAGGNKSYSERSFASNQVTSDTRRYERQAKLLADFPELGIGGPTVAWLFAACRAMDTVHDPDFHSEITIPTLMICASNDTVVSNRASEDLGLRLRSGSATQITGAKHELLHERDIIREQFLAAFRAFIPGTELGQAAE